MNNQLSLADQQAQLDSFAQPAPCEEAVEPRRRIPRIAAVDEPPVALPDPASCRVAVVGLGYVGLPLVCGFAENAQAIGFDIDAEKIGELREGTDRTGEMADADIAAANAVFTADASLIASAEVVVVCVPTPVDARNLPDYSPLLAASRTIGAHMRRGAVVVFESTVDPGATEGRCLPVLEEMSGLVEGRDFHLGYSPERINPADPSRRLQDIKKIVAGRTPEVTNFLAKLYARVVHAGLFPAASIKVAEAAKILENTQRDVNIALMNQMMALFDKMDIRASDVIAAASSKWNFHNYRPGLVGGHCIAVDPYWLVDAGRRHGLAMELVSASRAVNEATPYFVAEKLESLFADQGEGLDGKRILVLGRSFKEDCADTRNSKAYKMMDYLWARGADVFNYDPVAQDDHFEGGRGVVNIDHAAEGGAYHAIIVTLGHREFRDELSLADLAGLAPEGAPMIDLRGLYEPQGAADRFDYWRP